MAFIQMNVMSEALMHTVDVNVILPADKLAFPGTEVHDPRPFKTLYLLHGIFGSQFDYLSGTSIQRWAEELDLAVVMPAGVNRFYVDQEASHSYYGQFIGEELVSLTRKIFPLSDRREDTFLAGLSMGGYGALRNGLKYHQNFGYVAGMSVANIVEGISRRTNDVPFFIESRSYAESVFGDLDRAEKSDLNIKVLAEQLQRSGSTLPKIYLTCGTEDSLLPRSQDLVESLRGFGFDVTYEETAGGHEWDFWNRQLRRILSWLPLSGAEGLNSGHVGL